MHLRETEGGTFRTSNPNLIEFLLDRGHQPIDCDGETVDFEDSPELRNDIREWDEKSEGVGLDHRWLHKQIQQSGCPCVVGDNPSSWFAPPLSDNAVLVEIELDLGLMGRVESALTSGAFHFSLQEFFSWSLHYAMHAALLQWPNAEAQALLDEEDRRIRAWAERQGLLP